MLENEKYVKYTKDGNIWFKNRINFREIILSILEVNYPLSESYRTFAV